MLFKKEHELLYPHQMNVGSPLMPYPNIAVTSPINPAKPNTIPTIKRRLGEHFKHRKDHLGVNSRYNEL